MATRGPAGPTSVPPNGCVGPYRLERCLGAGATGTVYLARDAAGGAVALKVFHRHLWSRPDDERRWRHEAQLGLRLRSSRLARTLDYGVALTQDGPLRYVAMEYVEGTSLRALLAGRGAQAEASCIHVGRDVAGALAALHEAGVLHGDVKPENIMLGANHAARLVDLGFAFLPAARDTSVGRSRAGTLRYASPERLRLGTVVVPDGRSDLYALGVVLYEMAAGAHPFAGREGPALVEAHLREVPPDLRSRVAGLSAGFVATVERLLAKDPERRFPGAGAVVEALAEGVPADATSHGNHATEVRRFSRHETKLHGREAALRQVLDVSEALTQRAGRAVLVEGPGGIGKTRFVEELLTALTGRWPTLRVLRGAYHFPGDAEDAFTPYRTALRADRGGQGVGADVLANVRSATDAARLAAPLLSEDRSAPTVTGLTEHSLESVVIEVLASLGDAAPTIFFLEDGHLGPPGWNALFSRLAAALRDRRVLLVATCRPATKYPASSMSPADPGSSASRAAVEVMPLTLEPLTPAEVRALAADWLGTAHVPERLEAALVRASEGVPYVCLELLRDLHDRGALRRCADGTWSAADLGDAVAVPVALRAVLASRLGSLARDQRDVLDVLACSPSPLEARVVGEVLGQPEATVRGHMQHMERGGHLVETRQGHAFAHHLMQQAVSEALPPPLAATLHDGLADALARERGRGTRDPQDLEAALCWHRLQGPRPELAAEMLESVLRELRARLEPRRALALAQRALAAGGVLAGPTRVRVLIVAGQLSRYVGNVDAALRLAEEAVSAARASEPSHELLDALEMQTVMFIAKSDNEAALRSVEERRSRAVAAGDTSRAASAMADLAYLVNWRGQPAEALRTLDEGLKSITASPDPHVERRLRGQRSFVLGRLGRLDGALADARAVLASALRDGRPEHRLLAQTEVLMLLIALERVAESVALLGATLDDARRIGHRLAVAHLGNAAAWIRVMQGDFPAARREAEACLALEREFDLPRLRATALHVLAVAERQMGRLARVLGVCARARDAAFAAVDVHTRAVVAATEGGTALVLGRFDAAESALRGGLELLRGGQARSVVVDLRMGLADLAEARGLTREALDGYAECVRMAEEGHVQARRAAHAHCRMALALATSGATREAIEHARAARAATANFEVVEDRLMALATLACLGEAPVGSVERVVAEEGPRAGVVARMHLEHLLWRATGDARHAASAGELLALLCEHAPSEDRARMTEVVPLHREIREASRLGETRSAPPQVLRSVADPSS